MVVVFLATMVAPGFFSEWFAFVPRRILTQPWGAVTYMFIHGNGWHLFLNMLILFFFGPPLESRWGSREFVKYYFICGLGGVALSLLFASYPIIGASAAIYGLMLAFAMLWPNAPIHIWGVFPRKSEMAGWVPFCHEPHECREWGGEWGRPLRPPRGNPGRVPLPEERLASWSGDKRRTGKGPGTPNGGSVEGGLAKEIRSWSQGEPSTEIPSEPRPTEPTTEPTTEPPAGGPRGLVRQ